MILPIAPDVINRKNSVKKLGNGGWRRRDRGEERAVYLANRLGRLGRGARVFLYVNNRQKRTSVHE